MQNALNGRRRASACRETNILIAIDELSNNIRLYRPHPVCIEGCISYQLRYIISSIGWCSHFWGGGSVGCGREERMQYLKT
jgi:hypothetical protein